MQLNFSNEKDGDHRDHFKGLHLTYSAGGEAKSTVFLVVVMIGVHACQHEQEQTQQSAGLHWYSKYAHVF